jgi:hypothetical protein
METIPVMPKYYIKSGSLEYILSTNDNPFNAAINSLWEINDYDTLDEYFYVDERGLKDYSTALPDTNVFSTIDVLKKAGWTIN